MDWDPEPDPDPEPEPEPVPPTLRPPNARLAALHPPLAAPTGPPMPLDSEDPVVLEQLQVFCEYFANSNKLTPYNQLQRRPVRPKPKLHYNIKAVIDDPSNQELLAKLQQLGSVHLTERFVKQYAKAARARLGWSEVEAQLFIKLARGYALNADSHELQASDLDKAHVKDLKEEAAKQRRLLALVEDDSLQDTVPLPCRMRHAVHVCRCLEQWQPPHPCQGSQSVADVGVGVHFIKMDSRVLHGVCQQLGLTRETADVFTAEPARSQHWDSLRDLAPIKPHLQHLAAASSAGTSLEANLKHITVTLATWDAVWEVYLDPKWARQRLRLYGAQDRALEQFFKKDMAEVSMKRHGRAKQLVVFFGVASIGTGGRWAWSQQRDQPVRGMMWCPVLAPRKPPQAPRSSQGATPAAASEPGPSTPPPAKRSKRTKAEQVAEPTKGKGRAAKAKPAPQPGRWLDRDCNAAPNMQRIGESKWRPLELCWWTERGKLPGKGKENPELG
ncbi:hypothetical protein QJQ45_000200 [Haematococcus lacustris]|nr:hypothetical protein QJQ45_000200 [Haematococcus lacustris]